MAIECILLAVHFCTQNLLWASDDDFPRFSHTFVKQARKKEASSSSSLEECKNEIFGNIS